MLERGILFPQSDRNVEESKKIFCFADIEERTVWDENKQRRISHRQAERLDAFIKNIILKYF